MTHRELPQDDFIFGLRPVIEAINAGKPIDKVMIRKGLRGETVSELLELIKKNNISSQSVPDAKLDHYTRKNHQGVVALVSLVDYQDISEVIQQLYEQGKDPFIIMLDRITDVRNFGAIARTAECAGVDAILIPDKGAARVNAEAVKTSAGALLKIPVCRSSNIYKSAVSMLEQGIKLMSATEKGKQPYWEAPFQGPVCIIMGSEEDGVSAPLLKMSSFLLTIPQYGVINSLNVSVATGILLFEAARQRHGL
ncbi:MAG: 23S rRNA (guanosine(2251)-2'-O)-methyltransferase RlmB [Bacteroidales bacterium]